MCKRRACTTFSGPLNYQVLALRRWAMEERACPAFQPGPHRGFQLP